MSLQDDLRAALGPVLDSVVAEFPSTVTFLRRVTTRDDDNRPLTEDLPVANGVNMTVMLTAPTESTVREVFGQNAVADLSCLVRDTVALQPMDKCVARAGQFAGQTFWVRQVVPIYPASMLQLALTRKRPDL